MARFVILGVLAAAVAAGSAVAQTAAPSGSPRSSYWGPIEADSGAVAFVPRNPARAWWEYPVSIPYYAVTVPVRGLMEVGKAGVSVVQSTGLDAFASDLFQARTLPFGFRLGLNAGDLAGLRIGVDLWNRRTFASHDELQAKLAVSTQGDRQATLGYRTQRVGGFQLGGGHRTDENARFYGFGPQSREADRAYFRDEMNWGGMSLEVPLFGGFSTEVKGLYSFAKADAPKAEWSPSVPDHFGTLPFGFGATSDGPSGFVTLIHRDVSVDFRPESGGVRRVSAGRFEELNLSEGSHWILHGSLEQFIPLWHSQRALGLRAFGTWLEPVGNQRIPFQRAPASDEPTPFRGYREYRWRDQGIVGASAEYRWPIWEAKRIEGLGLDAYLLADAGQVLGRARDIRWDRLTVSYGGGLRLGSESGFKGRLEIAFSEEGSVLRLRTDQLFQYAQGSLFHGRKPTPGR